MLPPSPAILTSVRGKPGDPDELAVLWTFVVNGDPAQVGVAPGDEHIAGGLIALHREFVLNVPTASMIHGFDVVDFSSSRVGDKFAKSGFTRGQATRVSAPTVKEAPIQLECRLTTRCACRRCGRSSSPRSWPPRFTPASATTTGGCGRCRRHSSGWRRGAASSSRSGRRWDTSARAWGAATFDTERGFRKPTVAAASPCSRMKTAARGLCRSSRARRRTGRRPGRA